VAIAGKRARSKARQRTGCRSGVPWPGQGVGVLASRGCRVAAGVAPCWRCSITGSSSGSSSSRSVKPATKRRRRQCRAVPGGDRRQAGQGEGETAHRLPIGRAVAWSGCRVGVLDRRRGSSGLDHRQFGRVFVLSIGEAGHEATTAPVSSSAGWRSPASGPGRRRDSAPAADRACRDRRPVVPGRRRGSTSADRAGRGVVSAPGCWREAVAGVKTGSAASRSGRPR
jgi:hypothetical protein